MSQTPKKSGGRDISDLKARLGLNKDGGGPAAPKTARGPIVAPPGAKAPVPAPPGAKPPAPQMPSASDDPFAAMNAMAAVGVAHKAAAGPEIIVVNDGKPVEKVDAKSRAIVIGKYAAMVLVPLIIGISIGQISRAAKSVNKTIEQAGTLAEDVKKIRTRIQGGILDPLLKGKERGPGGTAFKLNDTELTEELGQKDNLPVVDPETAFTAYMFDMEKGLVGDILAFYSMSAKLREDVELHVKQAKEDAKHLADGEKHLAAAKPDPKMNAYLATLAFYRFGIYVEVPTEKEAKDGAQFGARLVEIGPPVCQDKKLSSANTCPGGPPIGFGYRLVGGGEGWNLMEFGLPQGENVPGKKLLPLLPTEVLNGLVKGGQASVAEVNYMKRVNDLYTRADELVKLGTGIEAALKAKANQSKSFTFFL